MSRRKRGGIVTLWYTPPQDVRAYRVRKRRDYLIHRLPVALELLGVWLWAPR